MAQKEKVKHKRRYCRIEGCTKIVKSQGLCQRHGAKTRLCKVEGCTKQAQGNFDGMCKLHFKIVKTELITPTMKVQNVTRSSGKSSPPAVLGESVYDKILPESIGWSNPDEPMPLIRHLKDGFDKMKPRAWHRNEERRARGLLPVTKAATQLEAWERELVWMEICLLSGNSESSFRALARAWGRDKGFHMVLAQFICERRGNVQRKKRVKPQGESSVTKKQRRAPVEMAPSGEELKNVMELDNVDFDMIGVLEGGMSYGLPPTGEIEDPTVNFSSVPNFSNTSGKRGGKRRPPMELAPMHNYSSILNPNPQHAHQPPQPQQHVTHVQQGPLGPQDMMPYHHPHHGMHHQHRPQGINMPPSGGLPRMPHQQGPLPGKNINNDTNQPITGTIAGVFDSTVPV